MPVLSVSYGEVIDVLQKVFVASEGQTTVREDVSMDEASRLARKFYDKIGGEDFFRRLTAAFYERVARDELLAPLFHGGWDTHARRLADYFINLYGTPDLQSAWEPRVLAAHTRFVITTDQRIRWLELMRAAGEAVGAPEQDLADFIGVMTIAGLDMTACSRGAAIARGQRIDRVGNVVDASEGLGHDEPGTGR